MSEKRVGISLIGCCVIRDIFGLHENDGGYDIKRYIQNISPISAVTKSPLTRYLSAEDDILFSGKGNFIGRCQRLELEKRVFDYLSEDMADYLVIDAAEFRRKIVSFAASEGCFSENYYLKSFFEGYLKAGIIPKDYDIFDPLTIYNGALDEMLQDYCDKLCSMYEQNRIILVEIKAGGHHSIDDEQLCIAEDETAEIFNERILYAFDFFRQYLKNSHIISFPNYVTIDYKHKWGRNLLHFVNEYYDYALNAVDIVTKQELNLEDEKAAINSLKEFYEKKLFSKYFANNECTLESR